MIFSEKKYVIENYIKIAMSKHFYNGYCIHFEIKKKFHGTF